MTHDTNYLCHHGVKGQKWGIRKAPDQDRVSLGKRLWYRHKAAAYRNNAMITGSTTKDVLKKRAAKSLTTRVGILSAALATGAAATVLESKGKTVAAKVVKEIGKVSIHYARIGVNTRDAIALTAYASSNIGKNKDTRREYFDSLTERHTANYQKYLEKSNSHR